MYVYLYMYIYISLRFSQEDRTLLLGYKDFAGQMLIADSKALEMGLNVHGVLGMGVLLEVATRNGAFLSHRATPSHHPSFHGFFHEIN